MLTLVKLCDCGQGTPGKYLPPIVPIQPGKTRTAVGVRGKTSCIRHHLYTTLLLTHLVVPLWIWWEEKEGAFLPPFLSSKVVIHLLLSFEMHLEVEQRESYFMRRKQECNADIRLWQLQSLCWGAQPGVSPQSCLATSHFCAGYPLCLGPCIRAWESIPAAGPEFGRSAGTGIAHCDCFHLLS